jgi:hemoglobin
MKDIQSREDLSVLVRTFYGKIRANEFIGTFFNETIDDWEEHLEKLTDFWESNLFFKAKFRGNPQQAHIDVDARFNHRISMEHFGEWLQVWTATIDELFSGELADRAKNNARKMATHLYLTLYQARPKEQ